MLLLHFAGKLSQMLSKTKCKVLPFFYVSLAVSLLVLPVKWVIAWFTAIGFHEFFHYIALRACGLKALQVELSCTGVRIETHSCSALQEAFCAAAGPLGSFLLVLLSPVLPRVALCGAFHGIYNLIPIYPLDGGRVLKAVLGGLRASDAICIIIEAAVIFFLIVVSLWSWIRLSFGPLPLIMCTIQLVKWVRIKIPCKAGEQAVQ